MKIVRRRSDNVVLYLRPDTERVEIVNGGLLAGRLRALDINSTDHEVVENVTPCPRGFIGCHFTYNGEWSVIDEEAYFNALPVPRSVPRLGARLALVEAEMWDQIEPMILSMPETTPEEIKAKEFAKAFYYDAKNWEYDDPIVINVCAALSIDDEQKAVLFKKAALAVGVSFF